jgi:hypothetical protein
MMRDQAVQCHFEREDGNGRRTHAWGWVSLDVEMGDVVELEGYEGRWTITYCSDPQPLMRIHNRWPKGKG